MLDLPVECTHRHTLLRTCVLTHTRAQTQTHTYSLRVSTHSQPFVHCRFFLFVIHIVIKTLICTEIKTYSEYLQRNKWSSPNRPLKDKLHSKKVPTLLDYIQNKITIHDAKSQLFILKRITLGYKGQRWLTSDLPDSDHMSLETSVRARGEDPDVFCFSKLIRSLGSFFFFFTQ